MSNERVLTLDLKDMIAPRFYHMYYDMMRIAHSNYYFVGGRGSTKSSFIAVMLMLMLEEDSNASAAVLRRVADTLRDSVVAQLKWAINKLGLSANWKATTSPLEIKNIYTGQKIIFRGADDPEKIKSVKVDKGHIKFIWFEELSEFKAAAGIRNIKQSLGRGGEQMFIFSFNPPKSQRNWTNEFVEQEKVRDDVLVHRSTYLTVPKTWLGNVFISEAKALKEVNPTAYEHEYLGKVVGTGAEVFTNIINQRIPDELAATFDTIYRGLDFGFGADPLGYVEFYYDSTRRRLYFVNEIYKTGMKNRVAVEAIMKLNKDNNVVIADSAEPRTIAEFRDLGLNIQPAVKGPGSVEHGIKWLQDLNAIIIDPRRTPNIYREFSGYELEEDRMGNLRGEYPDHDNHTIDPTRYAAERIIRLGGFKQWKK
ncbi:PBSX family phage terminase large subunit [Leuconostoc fallax]|uniref:PBSX family phage terminase, large subunit n=1 Tax=Leuconostoc fallax TaxID=1251 RepID=A0A4R5N8D7_9LACO|nr:PBSX family phage terminase large subunit [Leuconostoc fallax]TDG68061.1 hypothetical protein C5L23_000367 [Leuconostoc fallax]